MIEHVVREGDCFTSIAFQYGFFWETLWNLPENAELKQRRGDPFTLVPGDVVRAPDLRVVEYSGETGKTHRFKRRGVPAALKIRLISPTGEPRPDLDYVIEVDGKRLTGTTDGDGRIERFIPPTARRGRLVVLDPAGREEYAIGLGELAPIDTLLGVQARLRNLGFYDGPLDGVESEALVGAVQDFQETRGIDPLGSLDDRTRDELAAVYGA